MQRLVEPLLFRRDDLADEPPLPLQLLVRRRHVVHYRVRNVGHERLLYPQPPSPEVHSASQHSAHHVAPLLVRWRHRSPLVTDKERHRASVFGDDPNRSVRLVVGSVLLAGELLDRPDDRHEQVGLVDGRKPVLVPLITLEHEHGGDAFEPGARIDVLRRQRLSLLAVAVERHEHQVPDLHEPLAVIVRRLAVRPAAELLSEVVEDLGVRAARPDLTGEPVVLLLVVSNDALLRDARLQPEVMRLIIILVNRHPQPFLVQLQYVRHELPRPRDDLLLEVVAD